MTGGCAQSAADDAAPPASSPGWECGDRGGDRFDVPAGAAFTVRITPAPLDGIVLWRLNAVTPGECEDDVTQCAP